MTERILGLRNVVTRGQKSASTRLGRIGESIGLMQAETCKILSIPSLEIQVPEDGAEYLVMGPSGSGKSIFLRSLLALGRCESQFSVPNNTPCFISGSLDREGEFKMSLGDEYGSQIAVNQFNASIGTHGPTVDFRIMHDLIGLNVHKKADKPVIFICDGEVLYTGPMSGLWGHTHPKIQKYTKAYDSQITM